MHIYITDRCYDILETVGLEGRLWQIGSVLYRKQERVKENEEYWCRILPNGK